MKEAFSRFEKEGYSWVIVRPDSNDPNSTIATPADTTNELGDHLAFIARKMNAEKIAASHPAEKVAEAEITEPNP